MYIKKLHTPEGVKDYLPNECAYKEEIEKRIQNVFLNYGFRNVQTPMFEYMEVFEGKGSINSNQMYKFVDRDGSILSLRSDITPPIARVAATSFEGSDLPIRLSYIDNAFRYNEHYQGKLREFTQAGIELIGVNSVEADAEVLAIAINSLLECGLSDFRIDIGHVQFIQGVLEQTGISQELCESIQENIIKKNYVAVEDIVSGVDLDENISAIFNKLPLLIGGVELLDSVSSMVDNTVSLNAISHLKEIYNILKCCNLDKYIYFDLSVIGHLDYYTGLIFRGYAEGTGFSVIDGGRYDNLLSKFGANYPSVGFGIKVNDLMSALINQEVELDTPCIDKLVMYSDEGRANALACSDMLRKNGVAVENSLLGEDIAINTQYALKKDIVEILYFKDNENVIVFDLVNKSEKTVDVNCLLSKEAE